MPVFKVVTVLPSIQTLEDGSRVNVEKVLVNKSSIVAYNEYGAALIAGKELEESDEILSAARTSVIKEAS